MKLKLVVLSILSLSIAACDPNYDSQTIASQKREDKAITAWPSYKKWLLPDEQEIVMEGPTTTTTTLPITDLPAVVVRPTPTPVSEVPVKKIKNPLAGRLPITYPADFKAAGTIKPTVYYIPLANEEEPTCKEEQMVPMISRAGKVLVSVCPKTFDGCALQGSCFVTTKSVSAIFNFDGYFDSKYHYFEVDMENCPFGQGVKSGCLDPFYTVAADMTLFKAGDVIYIPQVAGTLLPNGETHHGYFIVRDTGGVIDGAGRFDFFSGFSSWRDANNPFAKIKLTDQNTKMDYFRVSGDTAEIVRKVRNYPSLPGY